MIIERSLLSTDLSKKMREHELLVDDEFLTIEEDEEIVASIDRSPTLLQRKLAQDFSSAQQSENWIIMIVDDDPNVHYATKLALKNFTFDGHPVELVSAFSATEGKELMTTLNGDVASILLDVVMESNHSGLEFVEFIRETLNNKQVRIILRTGQPGDAPAESIILDYDIHDYQLKLDMTRQRLITTIVSALRSFRDLVTIDSQNKLLSETLQKLKDSKQELKKYSHNLELLVSERTAELQTANEKLRRLATLDGLTQVLNRQYFDEYLTEHWQDSQLRQHSICLLLIDVDYFKPYNDCYGHLAGDDCLKKVAQAVSSALTRSEDIVARYGGEEFGILLTHTNYAGAVRVAKDIFRQIDALKIPHQCSQTNDHLTISMGISCLIPHEGMIQESLIEMADMALYYSKDSGRNQYSLYKDIPTENLSLRR